MATLIALMEANDKILLDDDDLRKFAVCTAWITEKGYVRISSAGKLQYLHRAIMDLPEGQVDHKNRLKLDCRKENLRIASAQLNSINQGARVNSKTGIRGVTYCSKRNKWESHLCVKGVRTFLGRYDTAEEAETRYKTGKDFYLSLHPEKLNEIPH